MSEKKEPLPMWILWRNKIDPIDLIILEELSKGTSESAIPDIILEKLKVSVSRPKVRERIEILEEKKIILKSKTIEVNPTKLHSNIYLGFIKTFLSRPPPLPPPYPADIKAWKEAFNAILTVNEEFGYPIRMLFNVGGTGDYDFIALIYTNNPEKYHEFKDTLVKRTGIIEKYDTKYVDVPELFYYDPILIPNYSEYKECLRKYSNIIGDLLANLKQK